MFWLVDLGYQCVRYGVQCKKDPMIDFGLRDSVGEHKQRKQVEKQLRPRLITIRERIKTGDVQSKNLSISASTMLG